MQSTLSRRAVLTQALLAVAVTNVACGEKTMFLDVVVFNYWPQPVIDVFINRQWGGSAPGAENGHAGGGGGIIAQVPITPGKQVVKWTFDGPENAPRLGEIVTTTFDLPSIPADHRVLVIVLFPNETVRVLTFRHLQTELDIEEALQ